MILDDNVYMERCMEIASRALGRTRTNPLVGSVIVHEGRIIGEGYHHTYGGPHAEVEAIRSVSDKSLLEHSTLYVNLEPCSHFGKTPPCSTLIIKHKIPRVVVSNTDPFPSVSGRGIDALIKAGTDVKVGVLEKEGAFLNRRFLTYHRHKRPYIILKWAETSDGFIDVIRSPGDPVGTNWITDEVSRTLVHKWRAEESGLMVGTNTIISDNPKLNVRRWKGASPLRITFDRTNRLPRNSHILDSSQDSLIFTSGSDHYEGEATTIVVDHDIQLSEILEELYNQKIISVMVEGGKALHNSFIASGLWDEARVFKGKVMFSDGISAPVIPQQPNEVIDFQGNELKLFYNSNVDELP